MLAGYDPSNVIGISNDEAAARLQAEGPNELPSAKPRGLLALAWDVVREPMLLLLVGAGIVYLLLGELKDSVVLLIVTGVRSREGLRCAHLAPSSRANGIHRRGGSPVSGAHGSFRKVIQTRARP